MHLLSAAAAAAAVDNATCARSGLSSGRFLRNCCGLVRMKPKIAPDALSYLSAIVTE